MFSSGKVVELFYDVVSPYSWLRYILIYVLILCFKVLCRYRNIWNINLKFKPAFLTGLMYMVSDLKLRSDLSEKDSLNVMCFVTAVAEKGKEGDTLERVSRELWTRKWHTHQDITQKSQLIKDKLKSVKEEALFYPFLHCFGFLFIVCHVNGKAKVFVGSDGFELMAYFIVVSQILSYPNKPIESIFIQLSGDA
uniref:DSBA-like thioredoxin domain-containing protein n=1 Tax=Cyprinus carpio TaxID=7962 RepID=A0A8C2DA70_CYPCA